MSLDEYKAKRNLIKSGEPEGYRIIESPKIFVVQKHAARRLHYDFRLAMNGVLKSWVIPKGPSLDPGEKRLAIHVEDHPMEYCYFEGIIPEGEYGAGKVLLWDRGEWEPLADSQRGYQNGKLVFRLKGEKLTGGWALMRLNGEEENGKNWLIIKEDDEEARRGQDDNILDSLPKSVQSGRLLEEIGQKEMPDPAELHGSCPKIQPALVKPMLATLEKQVPEGDDWLHEIKYDGYRIICRLENGQARLLSRNNRDWSDKFSSLLPALEKKQIREAIIDGEVVVLDSLGRSDFQALQNHLKNRGKERLVYYVFDLIWYAGYDLSSVSLGERKELLARILNVSNQEDSSIRYSDHIRGKGPQVFEQACRNRLEGIICKRADSSYVQRRSRNWLKIKCIRRQEFIIGGYTEPGGGRSWFGALLLGYYEQGVLVYCGRVGTGFNEQDLRNIYKLLVKIESPDPTFQANLSRQDKKGVHWVEPKLVALVSFSEWTDEGRLRHPSFEELVHNPN